MLRANAIKTSGGIEINWIDIPYDLLKQATERIEKKKGTCKFLPCARFQWDNHYENNFGTTKMYRVKNSDRIYPFLIERIGALVSQYGATPQEIEQTYNHIMADVLKEAI